MPGVIQDDGHERNSRRCDGEQMSRNSESPSIHPVSPVRPQHQIKDGKTIY